MLPCQFSNKKNISFSSAFFTIKVRVQSWFWAVKTELTWRGTQERSRTLHCRGSAGSCKTTEELKTKDTFEKKKQKTLCLSSPDTSLTQTGEGKANQHSSGSDTAWLKGKSHSGHFILFSCALGRRRGHLIMFYLPWGHSRGVGFLFFFNLNQYEGLVEKSYIKKKDKRNGLYE